MNYSNIKLSPGIAAHLASYVSLSSSRSMCGEFMFYISMDNWLIIELS